MVKKIFLTIMILCFMVSTVFAQEIIPTIPIIIINPATKIKDYSITFTPQDIIVKLNWTDAENYIIKESYITISGEDFDALLNATIQSGHVGQKFSTIMFKAIRTKCKEKLGIAGTVN